MREVLEVRERQTAASGDESASLMTFTRSFNPPDPLEERFLFEKMASDGRFRDEIIFRNLRLVRKEASKFRGRGVELPDLMMCGIIALIRAVDSFDPARVDKKTGQPIKFSTHATPNVRGAMTRAIAKFGRPTRIPENVIYDLSDFDEVVAGMRRDLGREPTLEELSEKTGKDEDTLRGYLFHRHGTSSLDSRDPCTGIPVGENIPCQEDPYREAGCHSLSDDLEAAFAAAMLSEKEKDVMRSKYGVGGRTESTLTQIAESYSVTRKMTSVHHRRALKKLQCREVQHQLNDRYFDISPCRE